MPNNNLALRGNMPTKLNKFIKKKQYALVALASDMEIIRRAAWLSGISYSKFITSAALIKARKVNRENKKALLAAC
jgi:uncharacterized protein (DUF1778 family)